MRFAPTDVHAKHRGVDLVEQTVASQLRAPRAGWTAPGCVRHDGSLDAAPAQRFQKRNGLRIQPRHSEDWLQKRCAELSRPCLVERLVRAEQFLKARRQRPNGVIGLLPIEK